MSPTCSNRFLAGRKARSAAVRITCPSWSRVSAELWASGRDLHAPPAHQHPDEAEPRRRVVVLAPRLSDVVVGEPLPFVTCRVRGDRFEPRSILLLRIGALAQRVADLLHPAGEVVAQRFEVPDVQHTRAARRAHAPVELVTRPGDGETRREL